MIQCIFFTAIITGLDHDIQTQSKVESKGTALNQNYGVETRMKRSISGDVESGAQIYDEVYNKLKGYIFNNPEKSKERSSHNYIEERINNIMSQLGEPKLFVMLTLQILFFQEAMIMCINTIH